MIVVALIPLLASTRLEASQAGARRHAGRDRGRECRGEIELRPDRQAGLISEAPVEVADHRSAAGQDDPAIDNVGGDVLTADHRASFRPQARRRLQAHHGSHVLALTSSPTDEDDGSTRIERARTAAYIAYQRSTTPEDESASLVTLATAFTKREEWRQALNALKLALALHETPELRATYEELREKYGFRVSNFSVDSDAASPRACFQFREPLPKRSSSSAFSSAPVLVVTRPRFSRLPCGRYRSGAKFPARGESNSRK